MKKILIQLDSDKFASTFDFIVAHDAGADVVQSFSQVTPSDVRSLVLSAFFTRGISDLKTLAVWIGGSDVDMGDRLFAEARKTFFGPFKVSLMIDSNGCNTTASTAISLLARQTSLQQKSALVIGPGPVGLRAAVLLAGEGCKVQLSSIPKRLLGDRFIPELAQRTLEIAHRAAELFHGSPYAAYGGSLQAIDAESSDLEKLMNQKEIVIAAGPAGIPILPRASWTTKPQLKWLLDFNLTEPLGIEGIKPADDFTEYDGKHALGALALGNLKMKVHKACIAKLFERNDLALDVEGVYNIAKQLM
jgi:methylenetetrahydrofolate/methylenetetrahydromethanopterin dehydrogenase (NADP+)